MQAESNERNWLIWLGKVRIIVITFLFGIELAVSVLTPTNLPKGLFVLAILLWYTISVFYILLVGMWHDTRRQGRLQVLTDLCMVAAVVYLTGGIDSSFNFLYPLIIIVAAILLSRAWAFLTAALAFIVCGALLELSYFDVIRSYSINRPDLRSLQASILINLFAYAAIAYLASQLSMMLRQADVRLQEQSGALENLQALHENIVNSISGGLITTAMDGRVRLINAAGQKLLGRGEQEVVGLPVEQLFVDHLPQPGPAEVRCEVRTRTPAGRQRTFGMTRSVLEVPERGAMGYVYTFDDLTEIRRLEREVRLRDRMAAVGRMAAAIAHEVRNPLSSIAGSVKVLADVSVLDQEQRTLVDIVTRESERLNNIVSDFLTYSREKQYQFATLDLVALLEDTLTLLSNRAGGSDGKPPINIVRRFEESSAPALVDGDRMKQVFWNICDNAMRAMPQGGTLTVSLKAQDGNWNIVFADTGVGLRGSEMEKIFEPFQSNFEGGTGLGLAIVYQIVQAHEGKVSVRSAVGKGTEFMVQVRQAAQAAAASESAVAARGARG
ncbi:MAG: two-component system sensor histidine kinase NtrB [Terriglobales bacterium]